MGKKVFIIYDENKLYRKLYKLNSKNNNNYILNFSNKNTLNKKKLCNYVELNNFYQDLENRDKFLKDLKSEVYKKIKIRLGSNLRYTSINNLIDYEKKVWQKRFLKLFLNSPFFYNDIK